MFHGFSLEEHVPADRLPRSIGRFVELSGIRRRLELFHSAIGRPSVDPELMVRMLPVGHRCGIRSERRLCGEVHLNLAHRGSAGSAWATKSLPMVLEVIRSSDRRHPLPAP